MSKVQEKIIYQSEPITIGQEEEAKNISLTSASLWNIQRVDNSGKALTLYCFFIQKALDQNSPQPWATDKFCARILRWNVKTVIKARKCLEEAKVIEIVKKRSGSRNFQYVRVNYLPFTLSGPYRSLSIEKIPGPQLSTYHCFDFYAVWFEKILYNGLPSFKRLLGNKYQDIPVMMDKEIIQHLETIWDRTNGTGYLLGEIDTELRFHFYLAAAVYNEVKQKRECTAAA